MIIQSTHVLRHQLVLFTGHLTHVKSMSTTVQSSSGLLVCLETDLESWTNVNLREQKEVDRFTLKWTIMDIQWGPKGRILQFGI